MKILFSILCVLSILLALPVLLILLIIGLPLFLKNRKSYLNYILVSVATSLCLTLVPLGYLYSFITLNKIEFPKYLMKIAVSIDQSGGVYMSSLLNKILIKNQSQQFGNPDETISSCIGRNKRDNNLTNLGKLIDLLLDIAEPNHSIKSIEK